MVSPSPSKQVLRLYLKNTVCLPPITSTLYIHSQIPIQKTQILIWRLGLVAGYTRQHHTVALDLTSMSEFTPDNHCYSSETAIQ